MEPNNDARAQRRTVVENSGVGPDSQRINIMESRDANTESALSSNSITRVLEYGVFVLFLPIYVF